MTPKGQFDNKLISLWSTAVLVLLLLIPAGIAGGPCLLTLAAILGWIAWRYSASRPVKIFCTFCGKCLLSDTNWTCGFCSHRNDWRTWYYSFLNKCAKCKVPPAIYACHYCDTPIPLTENVDLESAKEVYHSAYHLTPPELPGPSTPSRKDEREEAIAEIEFEVQLTKLMKDRAIAIRELRLEEEKGAPKPAAENMPKSRREKLEEELARERDEYLAVEEVVAAARKTIEQEYAGNPELMQRHLDVIERWREKQVE